MLINQVSDNINVLIEQLTPNIDDDRDKLIEIETTASDNKFTALKRISKSIKQYIEKEKDLHYIGLLGHFSTGKSSTINSLLDNDIRDSGLQPTDSAITLITHQKNKKSLQDIETTNEYMSVRTQFINNDILKDVVLVDTPGVGDPHIVNKMVKDFLPICDLILYFFQATNSLDDADIPLLNKKQQELPKIPIKFVITRADEFRLDYNKPLNDDNFNKKSFNQFENKLLERLKDLIKGFDSQTNDIYIIDNRAKYGIEKLKTVFDIHNNISHDDVINMNEHKTIYYSKKAKDIQQYFINIADKKIKTVDKVVSTISENIDNYTHQVDIAREKIINSWGAFRKELDDKYSNVEEMSNHYSPLSTEDVWDIEEMNDQHIKFSDIIEKLASKTAKNKKEIIDLNITSTIDTIKNNINQLDIKDLNEYNIDRLLQQNISTGIDTNIKMKKKSSLKKEMSITYTLPYIIFNKMKEKIIVQLKYLQTRTVENNHLEKDISNIMHEAFNSLKQNMSDFFLRVELFEEAVVNINTDEAISKLKITQTINERKDSFNENSKELWYNKAKINLFKEYDINSSAHKETLNGLNRDIQININDINSYDDKIIYDIDKKYTNLSDFDSEYLIKFKYDITDSVQELLSDYKARILNIIREENTQLELDVTKLKLIRHKKINIFIGVGVAILIFIYLINNDLVYKNILDIIGNITISIIGSVVTYFIIDIPNKRKLKNKNIQQKTLEKNSLDTIRNRISNCDIIYPNINEKELKNDILLYLEDKVNDFKNEDIFLEFRSEHKKLLALQDAVIFHTDNYKKIYKTFIAKLNSYFASSDTNMVLQDMSDEIKKKVMDTRFQNFKNFNNKANKIKDDMSYIEFRDY